MKRFLNSRDVAILFGSLSLAFSILGTMTGDIKFLAANSSCGGTAFLVHLISCKEESKKK